MENNFLFYFQEGINNHKKGNINEALISFDKCLSINPIDEEALINRGLMKYILKSYTSALNDYTKAIEINCQNNNAYYNRALCYKELSKYDDALSDLNIIKDSDPDYLDLDEEIKTITSILNNKPFPFHINFDSMQYSHIPALDFFERGKLKASNNNCISAIVDFNNAISLDSSNAEFFYERAICKFNLCNFLDAFDDFSESIKLGNSQAKYMFEKTKTKISENRSSLDKGNELIGLNKFNEAIKEFDKLISLFHQEDPNHFFIIDGVGYPSQEVLDAFVYRAYSKDQLNLFADAIEDYDFVLSCFREYADVYNSRATSKYALKDHEGALNDFTLAINYDNENPKYYINRGTVYFSLGRKDLARSDWEKASEFGDLQAVNLIISHF